MTDPVTGAASAGGMLRAAREKQGLHIAALAASIKVSQRKLEALEADRLSELPDATFARALAQTVCRTLKIDARPVLERLPPAQSLATAPERPAIGTPFRDRPGRSDPGLSSTVLRPMVAAGVLLALAAVALFLAPRSWWAGPTDEVTAPAPAAAPVASAPLIAAPPDMPAPDAAGAAGSAPYAETASVAPPAAAASAPTTITLAAAAPSGLLQLRSSDASWVEVRDARGQVLLQRLLQPGEVVGLDGALPFKLVIGNAAAVSLGFRGQPVDLAPRTRDNVARLELQ